MSYQKKNLDTYSKPEVTVPEFTKQASPDPTPNPSAVAETMPTVVVPLVTKRVISRGSARGSLRRGSVKAPPKYSDIRDPKIKKHLNRIRKSKVDITDMSSLGGGEDFVGGKLVEGYYDYEGANKYIEYYKFKDYKIVSVQRNNSSYRWVVNMSIYRPDKSTLFVIKYRL